MKQTFIGLILCLALLCFAFQGYACAGVSPPGETSAQKIEIVQQAAHQVSEISEASAKRAELNQVLSVDIFDIVAVNRNDMVVVRRLRTTSRRDPLLAKPLEHSQRAALSPLEWIRTIKQHRFRRPSHDVLLV